MALPNKGTLYCIPSLLGGDDPSMIPDVVKEMVQTLDHFIVEHPKSARHFLRKIGFLKDFDTVNMEVLDKRTEVMEWFTFLQPLQEGHSIGLISEAGAPGVADPGAQVIDDFSAYSLIEIFDRHIDNQALIETDGWTGYKAIKHWYPGIQQKLSDKGRNFTMIHLQIRNFKNWLRGTHSYSAAGYLQKYIEEYFYRFNRRTHRGSKVENLLSRIVDCQPITYKMIKAYAT